MIDSYFIEPENSEDQSPVNWNSKTILIAEDEDINYFFIEELLEDTGVTLIRAYNGVEAVEICKQNQTIDLILMDIKMPRLDGLDATKQIRKFSNQIPIIAQTAYAMSSDKHKSLEAGCNDYISKPINHELLFEMIDKYIS